MIFFLWGFQVILSGEQGAETFFEQWASEWLKPGHAPDLSLARCDSALTDQLLKALTSGESDLRSGSVHGAFNSPQFPLFSN